MDKNNQHHAAAKFFHWSIVILVIFEWVSGWLMPSVYGSMKPSVLVNMHISFGLLILLFIIALFCMRFVRPVDRPENESSILQKFLASATHYLLYGLIVIIPLSGWYLTSSRGKAVTFFDIIDLPALSEKGASLGWFIGGTHKFLAWGLGAVVVAHLSAALYHHLILKDSVLRRMVPGWFSKNSFKL